MKKLVKKFAAAGLALMMAIGMLTGCGAEKSEESQTKLFTYDGTDVYLDEAGVYARMTQTSYETIYMSTFGDSMWSMEISQDADGNPMTFEDMAKQNVIAQIKQVKVLVNRAEDYNIALTADEKKTAQDMADAFCGTDEGQAILILTGASEDTISKIYEENALAVKVQQELVKDVDTEVPEEEARQTTVYRLVFETTVTDEETGAVTDMSEEEKAEQKAKAEKALADIAGGKTIEEVAEELGLAEDASETYGAGESAEGEEFEAAMAALSDGETATEVFEANDSYVVAKLVAYTDEEATEAQKENIIADREAALYQEKYEELVAELDEEWSYAEDVDQEAWATIKFAEDGETTETEEETTEAEEATTGAEEGTSAAEEAATGAEEATTAAE